MCFGSDPGLESDLAAVVAKLDTLETALANASTATEVAALQAALTAAQEDITAILASNNVYTGDVNITNTAELAFATALGDKVAIVNGDVNVVISSSNGLTATAVNDVTSKIVSVVGSVTVTTTTDLDFSSLTSVSNAYTVSGKDINDSALKTAGSVSLSYTGVYSQPALTTAGSITLETSTVTTTTAVDFMGLTSGNINGGTLSFDSATSVKIGAGAAIISLTAPKALEVELHNAGTLASLAINTVSATSVVVKAAKVTGSATVTATGDVNLMAATEIGGAVTVNTAGDFSAAALTKITGTSTITAANVTAPALKTLTGAATVNKVAELSLPALTTVSGGLTAANLITLNAPILAATSTITTASATTYVMKSVDAVGRFASLATLKSITLSEQTADLDFGAAAKLETLNVTGKANTTDLSVGNAPLLSSLSLAGKLGTATVEGALAKLTTGLTTAGTIETLTISGTTKLTSATLNHTEDAANGANLTVHNNALLASLTTAINRVKTFVVTNNPKLATIDASSMTSMPINSTSSTAYTFNISGNSSSASTYAAETGLKGAFTAAAAATATTAATDAIYKQNSLLTVKPYLTTVMTAALATSATATGTVNLDYIIVNGTVSATTKVVGTAGTITSALKAEVGKIAAE